MDQLQSYDLFVWGLNENFLLSDEKGKSICTPTKVKRLNKLQLKQCSSGSFFNLTLTQSGDIFGWGCNKNGRIGLGNQENIEYPTQIKINFKIKLISCGKWHSLILTDQGEVLAAGYNKHGALGIGQQGDSSTFVKLVHQEKITQLAAGDSVSIILGEQGNLYSCGHKDRNGLGLKESSFSPQKIHITGQDRFKFISAGFLHLGAIAQSGQLYTWGDASNFQLGHGDQISKLKPTLVNQEFMNKIVQISFSRGEKYHHSGAVDENGNVFTWGSAYKGKLGHSISWTHDEPTDEPLPKQIDFFKKQNIKVKEIVCGGIHSSIIDENQNIWTFGCGSDGRLGHPESSNHIYLYKESVPRQIEKFKCLDLSSSYYHNIAIGYYLN